MAAESDQNTLDEANIRLNEKYLELKAAADEMCEAWDTIHCCEISVLNGHRAKIEKAVKNYKQKFGGGE